MAQLSDYFLSEFKSLNPRKHMKTLASHFCSKTTMSNKLLEGVVNKGTRAASIKKCGVQCGGLSTHRSTDDLQAVMHLVKE